MFDFLHGNPSCDRDFDYNSRLYLRRKNSPAIFQLRQASRFISREDADKRI